jgi:hypothetical protein
MAKFEISVPELHWAERVVEADTIEEAFQKVLKNEEDYETSVELGRTMEPSEVIWSGRQQGEDMPTHEWNGQEIKSAS